MDQIGHLLLGKDKLKEIPRNQPYIDRLPLKKSSKIPQNKDQRYQVIYISYIDAYTLKEIAEYLGIHYTTVSQAVKRIEEEDKM